MRCPTRRGSSCVTATGPAAVPLAFETTVGEQKRRNVQIDQHTTKEEYVAFRKKKDAGLEAPDLRLPSIQVEHPSRGTPGARGQWNLLSEDPAERTRWPGVDAGEPRQRERRKPRRKTSQSTEPAAIETRISTSLGTLSIDQKPRARR